MGCFFINLLIEVKLNLAVRKQSFCLFICLFQISIGSISSISNVQKFPYQCQYFMMLQMDVQLYHNFSFQQSHICNVTMKFLVFHKFDKNYCYFFLSVVISVLFFSLFQELYLLNFAITIQLSFKKNCRFMHVDITIFAIVAQSTL